MPKASLPLHLKQTTSLLLTTYIHQIHLLIYLKMFLLVSLDSVQKDWCEFEASMGYIVRSHLKKKNSNNENYHKKTKKNYFLLLNIMFLLSKNSVTLDYFICSNPSLLAFPNRTSLCSPGYPRTHLVDQPDL